MTNQERFHSLDAVRGLALLLGLFTYKYLVRSTFIGALLNGRRYQKAEKIKDVTSVRILKSCSISQA